MYNREKYIKIIVFSFIILNDIITVKCAEELEFWERDLKLENRRAHEKRNERNKYRKNSNVDPKFRYNHGKSKNNSHSGVLEQIVNYRARYGRGHKHESHQWPKQQQPHRFLRQNRRDSHPYESTRMTPMYLMQEMSDTTNTTHKKEPFSYFDINMLSPYGLLRQLKDIASRFTEANITMDVIGRTTEYNNIILMKMTKNNSDTPFFRAEDDKYMEEVPEKKIVFIVHGLSVMGIRLLPCLVEEQQFVKLLSYYLSYLDKFDIFLIPMANPDGVRAPSFFWNKNMSPQNACAGVALDRNFDIAWNSSRMISSCSQQYPGPTPFSEPETRAIRDVLHRYSRKIVAYLNVHAGNYAPSTYKGDAVLYPKGYTDLAFDDDKYIDMKGEIDEALKNATFQFVSVSVEPLHNWYGKVSGTSVDYAAMVYGIPFAMELVMQLYQDDELAKTFEDRYSYMALTEFWRRVIDVVFPTIWKHTENTDVL